MISRRHGVIIKITPFQVRNDLAVLYGVAVDALDDDRRLRAALLHR